MKLSQDQIDLITEVRRTVSSWADDWTETEGVLTQYRGESRQGQGYQFRIKDPVLLPLLESAQASIVPPDLTYTVSTDETGHLNLVPETDEKWLNNLKKSQNWIAEFRRACILAHTTGRCFLYVAKEVQYDANSKTARSSAVPAIRTAHFAEVFFPRSTQRARELPWIASRRSVYGRRLSLLYPSRKEQLREMAPANGLVSVIEIVDRIDRQIIRYLERDTTEPLEILSGKDFWDPWVFCTLGDDASTLLGVSPFRAASKMSVDISTIFARMVEIVDLQVPYQLADMSQLDEGSLTQMAKADPGDLIPVHIRVPVDGRAVPVIQNSPEVQINPQMLEMYRLAKSELSYITGISDIQRGQSVGARTATEISLIEMQTRSVAQMRQVALYDAFKRAGAMVLALEHCEYPTQEEVDLYYDRLDLTAVSASELNRAVLVERFESKIIPWIAQNPGEYDIDKIHDLFISTYGLDPSIRLSPEAKAKLAQQQQQTVTPQQESNPNAEPPL